ncbi:MAG TPA: hypothetical protein VFE98_02990 [Candidatus Bathyarchaeia archaeon]|nr:hypothetical protein [Candidatus Bathyarchaeia archaeon]
MDVVVIGDPTTSANLAAVKGTAIVGNEQALVVRNIPGGTQTVSLVSTTISSGTVTANQGNSGAQNWPTLAKATSYLDGTTVGGIAGVPDALTPALMDLPVQVFNTVSTNILSVTPGIQFPPGFATPQQNTFTATGTGVSLDFTAFGWNPKYYGFVVINSGATTWTVILEGSFDNANWSTILTHTNTDGSGTYKFSVDAIARPFRYFRPRCTVYTGAGSILAIYMGVP